MSEYSIEEHIKIQREIIVGLKKRNLNLPIEVHRDSTVNVVGLMGDDSKLYSAVLKLFKLKFDWRDKVWSLPKKRG